MKSLFLTGRLIPYSRMQEQNNLSTWPSKGWYALCLVVGFDEKFVLKLPQVASGWIDYEHNLLSFRRPRVFSSTTCMMRIFPLSSLCMPQYVEATLASVIRHGIGAQHALTCLTGRILYLTLFLVLPLPPLLFGGENAGV